MRCASQRCDPRPPQWKNYRYFDAKTVGLDFAGMVEDLKARFMSTRNPQPRSRSLIGRLSPGPPQAAPDGSIVVLHGCAHNPTGIDPTEAQWGAIADLCVSKKLVPFFDVAYQACARQPGAQ